VRLTRINLLFGIFISIQTLGQTSPDTLPFIQQDKNRLTYAPDNQLSQKLKKKLQNINLPGAQKINILHLGDSHLQAAFLSEEIRQALFLHYFPEDTLTEPGFIFPYTLANTNNPFYYQVDFTGQWDTNKNTDDSLKYKLGISGITVATNDTAASFSVKMQNKNYPFPVKYYFNRIKIFHSARPGISVKINGFYTQTEQNYSHIHFPEPCDSVNIEFTNPDTDKALEVYGLKLEYHRNKLAYHTIGVNGATAQSYLKCELLPSQLIDLNPDLVILSLGTNETYNKNFSALENKLILKDLIHQIKAIVPEVSVVLVSPGDHMKHESSNPNLKLYRQTLIQIKDELNTGFWDFYSVMGGDGAMLKWHQNNLTASDKIHFKRAGYQLQGQLFVKAFLEFFDDKKR
jgi:lysophospholipase L1-like esterase